MSRRVSPDGAIERRSAPPITRRARSGSLTGTKQVNVREARSRRLPAAGPEEAARLPVTRVRAAR